MAGRHSPPRWRFPLLVVALGAGALLFIAFAENPLVKWAGSAAIGLVVLIAYFGDFLIAVETNTDRDDQAFRQRRFKRWQKNARSSTDSDPPK